LISDAKYLIAYEECKDVSILTKGTWLVILHASRIPPHVGLMIDGNYNSLTIKERELNVPSEALLKMIGLKKIEALFVKVAKHPVFSSDHQLSIFQEQLNQFTAVKPNEATCLSPLKLFFEEFYAIRNNKEQLFYDFIEELNQNDYLTQAFGLNIGSRGENNIFTLPHYTNEELQTIIKKERETYFK
jgi:hypothetical protein